MVRQLILQRWPSPANARRFIAQSTRLGAVIDEQMIEVINISARPA